MRIAVVTTHPPGTGTLNEYGYHFVEALRQKPEVSEVILLVDHLEDNQQYEAVARTGSNEETSGQAPMKIIPCWRFNDRLNALHIVRTLRKVEPDCVLFNIQFASFGNRQISAALGLLAPRMARAAGFPTMVLLHNIMETADLSSAGFAQNRFKETILRTGGDVITRFILGADLVALTIPKYVEILTKKYGADNVILAPHGSFDGNASMPNFDLPNGPKQIVTFGKFGTYKKVEGLIEAIKQLRDAGLGPIELTIAGTDSPNAAGYLAGVRERYADVEGLSFTGYVAEEDIPRLFSEAATVVFPYTSTTGSSGVLHQSSLYGTAAVMPKIGDFAELISEEGYDGEYFEPDSVSSLANAIRRVVTDDERRRQISMRNYMAACGLPISEVVDWYVLHLEALISERQPQGTTQGRTSKSTLSPLSIH
jgi:glycosyltransferase involved in cell wall biosynthesis